MLELIKKMRFFRAVGGHGLFGLSTVQIHQRKLSSYCDYTDNNVN